jgi:CheY-like chemotaxis protein
MRVLVVEDNPETQEPLIALLCDEGHVVDYAGNGDGALVRMTVARPDFMLLDHMMPSKSGLDFLKQVRTDRSHPDWAAIPAVIVTAVDSQAVADIEQAIVEHNLHPAVVVRKPCDPGELLALVSAHAATLAQQPPAR